MWYKKPLLEFILPFLLLPLLVVVTISALPMSARGTTCARLLLVGLFVASSELVDVSVCDILIINSPSFKNAKW